MFGAYRRSQEVVAHALNAVEATGDPWSFRTLTDVCDMETLVDGARARRMHIAGFPEGGLTILPRVPVTDAELLQLCVAYCRAETHDARACLRRDLYLRTHPSLPPPHSFPSSSGVPEVRPLWHPADQLMKLMELCARVVAATEEELRRMMEHSPYLHVAHLRDLFQCVRVALTEDRALPDSEPGGIISSPPSLLLPEDSPWSPMQPGTPTQSQPLGMGSSREERNRELDSRTRDDAVPVSFADATGSASPSAMNGGMRSIEPHELFSKAALEEREGEETEHVSDGAATQSDLTGHEQVDQVRAGDAEYLNEADFELVTESGNFYDGEGEGKRLVAVYRVGALHRDKCKQAAEVLAPAATKANQRARTNGGELPDTGIVGYYDYLTNPTPHKCRETSFMRQHLTELMHGCAPLLKDIDHVYKTAAPVHYRLQQVAIPTQFQLFDTVFSTITVNRNFRTAVHTDRGDFRSGFGVLTVIDGSFAGCHLGIKKLKRAFRIRVGDVLLFDTSLEHGNTEVHGGGNDSGIVGAPPGWTRLSLVCYLRNGLMSSVCELARRRHLNGMIVSGLAGSVDANALVDINHVDRNLPPLLVPARLLRQLGVAQLSALTFVCERARKRSGAVLGLTMGLGKTLVALILCFSYLKLHPLQDVLVLVPKPIIRHWLNEVKKWSAWGLTFRYLIASSDDSHTKTFGDQLLVYEQQLYNHSARRGHLFILNPEYLGGFLRRFKRFNPMLIIADEGHKVASRGSKLTASLSRLTCPLRVVLSGTPLQNNAEELYRLVGWVNSSTHAVMPPRHFTDMAASITRYIKGDDDAFHEAVVAQRFIQDWMKGFVFREMEVDLPPLFDYVLVCDSSATQRRIEDRIGLARNADGNSVIAGANDHRVYHLSTHPLCYWAFVTGAYQSMLRGAAPSADIPNQVRLTTEELHEIQGYQHLVEAGRIDLFAAHSGKLTVLLKIVQEVRAAGEKVIIFSQYIGSQDLVHRTLTAVGISVFSVRGRDSRERREEAMAEFAQKRSLTALVLSTKIAAFGLDFTPANHVVLFDSWWNPQVDAQAVARAYRHNQKRPVTVYRLACEIEDRSVLAVQTRKLALFHCIMRERTTRSAQPHEVQDCADREEDRGRWRLWRQLKARLLEGDYPALRNVYLHTDSIKEVDAPTSQHQQQQQARDSAPRPPKRSREAGSNDGEE